MILKFIQKSLAVSFLGLIFYSSAFAKATFEEGKNYQVISSKVTSSSSKNEVIEFFSYGCPGCFVFENYLSPWVKEHQNKIHFKRVPVVFHPAWFPIAKAYYIAKAYGKEEELTKSLFEAIHQKHQNLSEVEMIQSIFERHGISKEKFQKAYFQSSTISMQMKADEQIQNQDHIEYIPAVVVHGKYMVHMNMADHDPKKMIAILNYLLEQKA